VGSALLKFKHALLSRAETIKERAHLSSLDWEDLPGGAFALTARWSGGELRQEYTRQYVLGPGASVASPVQRPRQRICAFQEQLVGRILNVRRTKADGS